MECSICSHPKRAEIEKAILRISTDNPALTMEQIAEEYDLGITEIRKHAVLHQSLNVDPVALAEGCETLARRAKIREASILEDVVIEYYGSLKNLGTKINRLTTDQDETKFTKLLTKPVVDMYLGLGSEIRQTVNAMAELDRILNGPKDDNASGLAALASAIAASQPSPPKAFAVPADTASEPW